MGKGVSVFSGFEKAEKEGDGRETGVRLLRIRQGGKAWVKRICGFVLAEKKENWGGAGCLWLQMRERK